MKLNEFLTESQHQELELLQEGPLGSLVKAAGRGVGNVIGGVARTAGAVKGAVKGAVDRAKSSFAGGQKDAYDALTGKNDSGGAAGTTSSGGAGSSASGGAGTTSSGGAGGSASAAGGSSTTNVNITNQPAAQEKPAAGSAQPQAAADPAATTPQPKTNAGDAAQPEQPAADAQSGTAYAQAQKAVNGLAPEQRKEIIKILQADPKVTAAMNKPAAKAKQPAAKTSPGANAFGSMAAQLAGPKTTSTGGTATTTPTGTVHRASANNPNQPQAQTAQATTQPAAKRTRKKPVKIGGATTQPAAKTAVNAGLEKKGTVIKESFSIFRRD